MNKKRCILRAGMTALFLISLLSPVEAMEVSRTFCEALENPVGIATPAPRFGWQLRSARPGDRQSAYQIVVTTSRLYAEGARGDVWDSGAVVSGQSQWIRYEGVPLKPGVTYYWRVRVWDSEGELSPWSEIATWEQAPEQLQGEWIGAIRRADSRLPVGDRSFHAPSMRDSLTAARWGSVPDLARRSILLRRPVRLPIGKRIKKAVVYISGLGHYELTVNGQKVGDSYFAPLWSDYDKTVYYNTYSLEEVLEPGENVFGVVLGNGFYNTSGERYRKLWITFGPPTLFFQAQVTYDDGTRETIVSDERWKWAESPITFNCLYGGEDYDARLEQPGWDRPGFDDRSWRTAVSQGAPKGALTPQLAPPVKIRASYPVKTVTDLGRVKVFDMGQNLAGFPTLRVKGAAGQVVRMTVGESLNEDGTVSQQRTGGPHYYEYTLKGEGEEVWSPRFSYYGYQYLQIDDADYRQGSGKERPVVLEVTSNFVYNNVAEAGTFACSNDIFNRTHGLINNAIKSNMQAVFTDCPQREKLGWLEQVYLNGPGLYYNYDLGQLIPKVMRDMADAQRENGLVPSIVPEYTDFTIPSWGADFADSPEWGTAVCVTPWQYYTYYGDSSLIEAYYPQMRRYVDYLGTKADGHILSHGLGDWYDYGDHPAGYSRNSPISISATAHWYLATQKTLQSAELVGDTAGVVKYGRLAEKIKAAFNREFFHPETKQYATGSQFSNAIAIYLELVDPADRAQVLQNLVDDIRSRGVRLTTGDIGNRYLFRVLADNGWNELMYEMHNHYDAPGYGYQLAYGLTTLTEQWDPGKGNSWNHFMMGQIEEWFYSYLAGIRSENHSGFREILFAPQVVGDLTYAKGSHRSLYGEIRSEWIRQGRRWSYTVEIPVNCTGRVVLPEGVENVRVNRKRTDGACEMRLGSGQHRIECTFVR